MKGEKPTRPLSIKVPNLFGMQYFESRSYDEILEILEEENELILELEDLCTEAKERRKTYQGSVRDFLMDSMYEIDEREAKKKLSTDNARELRDTSDS
ncbi:hypothetical protein HYFRA_00001890 [Hymenoscyphus fraxineus]|uniref:Uncharacterized protein n=1 Tax=Hymenoscyphus fraxineus TaxID=746836 RepID=A0A9N9KKR2_9HELO|nr:hypothetical protein HYFRA_00001890 [Hymenoscyphus fraxineus]